VFQNWRRSWKIFACQCCTRGCFKWWSL